MFRTREASLLFIGVSVFSGAASLALPASATGLAAHRAVYDLELASASERSGIDGMYGRMVYEFSGSACTGYKSTFRFVTAVSMEGDQRINDQRTETFEDMEKGTFKFATQSYTGESLNQTVSGEAKHDNGAVDVTLEGDEPREVELDSSRFPTEHMLDVVAHAKRGDRFFQTRIFDGSESGDKTLFATAVIGKENSRKLDVGDEEAAKPLQGQNYWPVSIAYFSDEPAGDDELPIYRMSFDLYENGISRDLTLDYGDFVLTGQLAELDMLEQPKCK
ncbi:cell envelope integrity EipB family protein [Rhizobium sp. L1K21]|uniref:cell envelope integrity EipB family protein n=1 Tax=Rhizobium sp. L1K21 TaxID=2954933 RepID=UPI002093F2A3|nr:cell envelope integrity EipB family protein [Rhizobium sp. L1K21]MCO6185985.1 cell envelope integrity EipB family protein [Rhizobium sp. L1K21]